MNKILALLRTLFNSGGTRRHRDGMGSGYHHGEVGRSYDRGREEYLEEEDSDSKGVEDAPQEDQSSEEEYVEEESSAEEDSPSEPAEEEEEED